jgi:hypothetical protein
VGCLPSLSLTIQADESNGWSDFPVVSDAYTSLYPKIGALQAPLIKLI